MTTEQTIAILGLVVALIGGLAGPYLSARFASARLSTTLEADRRKDLVAKRRELLDQGALLLVEFDDALARLRQEAGDPELQAKNWDGFRKKMSRFRTRLELWFDEGSDVVDAFAQVLHEVERRGTSEAGRHQADNELRAMLTDPDQLAQMDEAGRAEAREHLADLDRRQGERMQDEAERVDRARHAYLRAARHYLAGDPGTRRA